MRVFLISLLLPLSLLASELNELVGTWTLQERHCGSGAPPAGPFHPPHDFLDLEFFADYTVREDSSIYGCRYELHGTYNVVGQIVSLRPHYYWTSCRPVAIPAQINYSFKITNDKMDMYLPVRGGVCPAGDVVQLIFKKIK